MAALETIRTKFGVLISVIIALSLLIFILDNDTIMKWFSGDNAKAHQVAVIDGQTVTIEEFQTEIESLKSLYGGASSAEVEKSVREQAWQSVIDKYLFVKNAEAAGIKVGTAELVDLTSGDHISPIISQNFASTEDLRSFISQNEEGWSNIQDMIRNQQYYNKYNALFVNSYVVNPLMLNRAIEENNVTADVDFVTVPFGYVVDTTVNVSSSEIKKYYKEHKRFFKQQESRDLEYVVIDIVPSQSDIAAAEEEFNALYEEFRAAENVKNFLLRNSSEENYTGRWYKAGELNSVSREVNAYAFESNAAISQIIKNGESFLAARVVATANRPETVTVKIVPMGEETTLTPAVLADLEASQTLDMTQDQMIAGTDVLFTTRVNQAVIIESAMYGKLAAKVVSASAPVLMKQVAVLKRSAVTSNETISGFYAQANAITSRANGKYENFKTVCDTMGYYVHPANKVARSNERYGNIDNAREVTNWAFKAKKGQVSDIITINQRNFVVAALTGTHKEGYQPIAEVSSQIKDVLYNEKAGEKKAAEIKDQVAGMVSLEEIAENLGTTVSHNDGIAFASMDSQALDPAFIGAVASAEEGELTGPVAGSYAVYIFRVNSRDTGAFYTEDDAKAYANRMMQYSLQTILPVMMDDADVKDNRARFF